MLLRQLEYFVAVSRERHFARAAEACYVSQPALSASIAKLERELNVTLINRGRNFEGLTVEGERLVVWAKRVLAVHDGLVAEAAALRSGISGVLRLGTGPTVSTTTALPIAAFCSLHPLARVKVCSHFPTTELVRQLRSFELDAAIAHFDMRERNGLELVPLYHEECVLLVSGKQLVPSAGPITWSEAAQLPLALLAPEVGFRHFVDDAFANVGAAVVPQIETDSMASICAHVATGSWASIVPHTWFHALPATGAMRGLRLVEPEQRAPIAIAIHASAPGSAAARAFLNVAVGAPLGRDDFTYGGLDTGGEFDPDLDVVVANRSARGAFVA
ncbi:LysR family transcriptional regulator [Mycobacterium sp. Aquia_216]|uniref:LysR family transcriptional regulator n=1 Tax=Mycobacterium sp. Aquia_216 TaxID=2991729 RepID=UPI002DD6528D|nr:LysR family transcriptional regulator [Mycobacterium sp. Aquia_216]